MATLLLDARNTLSSLSLRTWLREDWAILFSHPNDFVSYDLEMDRWLVITRRAFAERRIHPIALASPTPEPDHTWVTQVSGDDRTVLLEDPVQQHSGFVDLQAPVLREAVEESCGRFVMIIDAALRIQKKFTYEALSNLPSPLELLGWAGALRAKRVADPARSAASVSSGMIRVARKVPARDLNWNAVQNRGCPRNCNRRVSVRRNPLRHWSLGKEDASDDPGARTPA